MSQYCSRCGCYLPDKTVKCLACGTIHEEGSPTTPAGQLPRQREAEAAGASPRPTARMPQPRKYRCQAAVELRTEEVYGRLQASIICEGEKRSYQLNFTDIMSEITETELIERICEGCGRRT